MYKGNSKLMSYWFVLTSEALFCFSNDNHDVKKFTLPLNAYQMSATEESKNITLDLRNADGDGQTRKKLILHCKNDEAFDAWNAAFEWVFNKDPKVRCYFGDTQKFC